MRRERPGDEKTVFEVNLRAFVLETEAGILDLLRVNCPEAVSLVEENGDVVVRILFTEVQIEGGRKTAGTLRRNLSRGFFPGGYTGECIP
jgi:predicted N-acetyltransferase YhbS